jgi:uncharacterized membrane protein
VVEFTYNPDWRWWLAGGVLITALMGWSYHAARGGANAGLRLGLLVLRLFTLAVVVICLLDPQRVEEIRHFQPAYVAVLVDTSRSMAWKDNGASRLDLAKKWVREELKLPEKFSVSYYGFGSNLFPLPNLDTAVADGNRTALAGALENLATATAQNPPASVVLLSDGGDNSLQSAEAIAKSFGQRKIPIHTLSLGATNEPPDIVVENVQVKRALLNQSTTKAVVTLRSSGFDGQTVPLRVLKDNKVLAERKVQLAEGSQRVEVEFTPALPGFQTFVAEIPVQSGERLTENNRREFGLTVVDQVLRVIYMEASGDENGAFQPLYLKHALEDTPGIQVKTLYVEQYGASPSLYDKVAYVDPKNGDKIYRVQHPTQGYPRTLEELLKYQVVIFSDVSKDDFTPEQLQNTERFITEFGGGFAMVGGHTSFGAGGYQNTIIDNLIPVAMEGQADLTSDTFHPNVLDSAWTHPIMRISSDPEENRAIWTTKFPQLQGYNRVSRAKPGASVLLEHPTDRTPFGPAIILATQEVGKGRTMALTTDTTYLWGEWFETIWGEKIDPNLPLTERNCDSRYFKQFWLNSIRWLSAHKFDFDHNLVSLELAQTYCAPNLEVPVRVRAANRGGQDVGDAGVTLHLMDGDTEVQSVRAVYSEEQRSYQANVKLPGTGKFRLQATAVFKDGKTADDQQILVGEDADWEMADIRAKPENLAALSRWSGGEVFSPQKNDAVPMANAMGGAKPATVEYRKTPYWDKSWWLGTIIGLLSVEWVIRRLRGMA